KRGPAPARVRAGRHENGAVTEPGHRSWGSYGGGGLPPPPTPPSPPQPSPPPLPHPPTQPAPTPVVPPSGPLAHHCPVGSPFALLPCARAPTSSRTTPRRTATLRPGRRRSRPGGPLGRSRG